MLEHRAGAPGRQEGEGEMKEHIVDGLLTVTIWGIRIAGALFLIALMPLYLLAGLVDAIADPLGSGR